jgi:transcriptional regulator of acetoin/glycerol metabolism
MQTPNLTEEQALRKALDDAAGSPTAAAQLLGVTRMTVWRRMRKYGIAVKREIVKAA